MTEALIWLAGALTAPAAFLVGWLARGRGQQSGSRPIPPVCACGHAVSAHAEKKGCRAEVRREHYYSNGFRNGWEWVSCACLKYTGPEPISSDIWVPPMATLPERSNDGH